MSDAWADATWDGARRVQIEQAATATPAARLEWLEQAIELAYRTGALPRRARPG